MEHVIFGFGADMDRYLKMDIFLYLILFSLMIGVIGKVAFQKRMVGQYLMLIRYDGFSTWWYRTVLRVLGVSVLLVLSLFAFGVGILKLTDMSDGYTRIEWMVALLLWLVGLCTIAMIQTVLIQFKNGYKITFALFMCIQVLSLYFPELIGSWLMYARSKCEVENGFSVVIICVIQMGVDILIGLFGYCLFKPRRGYEFSD